MKNDNRLHGVIANGSANWRRSVAISLILH